MAGMTIGALARSARVNVETIRYYQRIGLLETPARPAGGVRRYGGAVLSRIRFIKRAQELGFSLSEIGQLARLGDARTCGQARALAAEKLERVQSRIADLARLQDALRDLIGRCDRRHGKLACPIVETLSR